MTCQVFTRRMRVHFVGRPRRFVVCDTDEAARDICTRGNARLSAKQRREGMRYEYMNLARYQEAFGP